MSGKLVSAQIIEIVFSTIRRHILLHEGECSKGEVDYVQNLKHMEKWRYNATHSQLQIQIVTVLPMGKPSLIPTEARQAAEPLRHFGVDKTLLSCR